MKIGGVQKDWPVPKKQVGNLSSQLIIPTLANAISDFYGNICLGETKDEMVKHSVHLQGLR